MDAAPKQCPFLDLSHPQCSARFQLDNIEHAFKFCFGRYKACPTYFQLQVENRLSNLKGVIKERGRERTSAF